MTGKKQQIEPKEARRDLKAGSNEVLMETVTRVAQPKKGGSDNAKVQMQDFHFPSIKSPRDSASGQAT